MAAPAALDTAGKENAGGCHGRTAETRRHPKMLDGFHKELRAIRTLLEQLLELERERIERDQAA